MDKAGNVENVEEHAKETIKTMNDLGVHKFKHNDREYVCYPEVYSPVVASGTLEFAEKLPYPTGGSFCEVGTGMGLVAIESIFKGCSRAVGLEISEAALKNAQENAKNLDKELAGRPVNFYFSDVFSGVPEGQKFDMIYWNYPCGRADKELKEIPIFLRAFIDPGYEHLEVYFREFPKYLTEAGHCYLLWHLEVADNDRLKVLLDKFNLDPVEVYRVVEEFVGETLNVILFRLDSKKKEI